MLSGKYRGTDIGSGTNVWSMSEDLRAGKITLEEFHEAESCMHRSHGHCMTMGTASTMASMVEALGVGMPGNAAFPAVDARRNVLARMAGRRIVEMVKEKIPLVEDPHAQAFENAIRANAAIGGSTNAVIHLIAIARPHRRRSSTLEDFDRLGRGVHTLVNLMPSGKYLMEDFCYAGGLPAVLRELGENGLLHKNALTVNGKTIWENVKDAPCWNREVIYAVQEAVQEEHRHRGAARQPLPRRRDHQALRRDAEADEAPRPRGGVREHRGLPRAHRRPEARHRRALRHGAEELRAEGLSRHGRGRQHAAAAEAAEEGHHRHGAHLGRAHERHRLRHGGAARLARGGRGRPAGAGARTAT